jgi:TonB-dependent starch-binding outer membrane protein SusC
MLLAIMRKSAMLLLAVIGFTAFAAAQTVTGTVTDSKGDPVSGISVTVKGTTKGAATNAQGVYTLNDVANGATLVFTGAGFTSQSIKVTGGTVNVSMATSTSNLNEVVVIGYGSVRKKDLTGAVGSVKAKDFNQGFVTSPDQLLQNKVSGLEITNNSGQPGVATTIKIRGNNSIRAVNNPLYVIDGVPLDGRTARPSVNLTQGFGSTPESNPLLYINPNDIAQIDVLKDASSAAIYGARGANGVIVITTKKATSGGTKLEFGTSFGTSAGYLKQYEVLNAGQFKDALGKYNLGASALDFGSSVDALKEITQKKLSTDYSLALSSGNENGSIRASFLASRANGFLKGSNLDKYLGAVGGQYKFLDKKLSIDFNLRGGQTKENITNVSNTADSKGNLISSALSWNPTQAFKNAAGDYIVPGNGSGNPLAFAEAYSDIAKVTSLLADISAGYKILKNLDYKFLFAVNTGTGERNTNVDGWLGGYNGITGLGVGAKAFARLNSQTITHTLNYKAKLTSKLNLDALGGYEYWKTNYSGSSSAATGFNTNLTYQTKTNIKYTDNLGNGKTQALPGSFTNPTAELQSFFGRVVLNYADKYVVTATMRADGSSKFGKNNKYGYFPAVAAKWTISNENFMKGMSVINNLAIRASYGITGNQEFPAGASQEQFSFGPYNSVGQINVANPDLKWEETKSFNIGLDYSLMKGRIYGSLEYYDKNTTNILFQSTAIQPAPASIYFINLPANLTNKGVEFSIGAAIIDKTNFGVDVNFNIANNKNLLKNFNSPGTTTPIQIITGQINGQGVSGTLSQIITSNQPVNEFYLKKFNGFDASGKQLLDAEPGFAGDPNPHTIYGFGTSVRYKKLNLSINAGGASGFMIYNNTATNITNLSGIVGGRNIDLAAYNSAEKTSSSAAASTRFLEKGDYFKLRNATVRYSFGNVGKYLKGLAAFVSGSNLFVITKFTGFDPEVNIDKSNNAYPSRSIEYVPYPTPRTFSFGFNLSL